MSEPITPEQVMAELDSQEEGDLDAAVEAVNAKLKKSNGQSVWIPHHALGPTPEIRRTVMMKFRLAGWTVDYEPAIADGNAYIFSSKARIRTGRRSK